MLLNVAFGREKDLLSNSNISKTYKECYLRNLIKQEEDSISSLEDAAKRSFSVQYIHRLAKMLILQNREASEAVNSKLRDLGLGEVDLDGDDKRDDQSRVEEACVDLYSGVGQSTDLISLVGCNPIRLVKDEEELQVRMKSLTPSQMEAFKLMTNSSQQRLLFVTGPGGLEKVFLSSWSSDTVRENLLRFWLRLAQQLTF
jgi:hypothetical protein